MTVKRFSKLLNKSAPSPFEPLCVLCSKNMRSRLFKVFCRHPFSSRINLILACSKSEMTMHLAHYYQSVLENDSCDD